MNFWSLKKTKHQLFFIFLSLFMASCISKILRVWNNATFDSNISKAAVYTQLDKQNELFSFFEKRDSLAKQSSDVEYSSGKLIRAKDFNNFKINNCRAYFQQSDTLSINIGIGTGFGGQGFIIKYKDKKFYTEPYYHTDIIIPGETSPTYKIIYQKLILDKSAYKAGDSLYGYIDFKSIEIPINDDGGEQWGKGYFRARISER